MTENNRFKWCEKIVGNIVNEFVVDTSNDSMLDEEDMLDMLNGLYKENQELKAQLLYDDSVCDICKHECLVKKGKYYVSECKKGHEECSTMDLPHCGDFELKEGLG